VSGTVNPGSELLSSLLGCPAWTPMSTLLNSWVWAGSPYVAAQYRLWPLLNSVEIIGTIKAGAAATFYTLPAGWRPVSQQGFPAGTSASVAAIDNVVYIQCDTSGNLTANGVNSASDIVYFHGWISLDA
jgi:hypothetical protein